MFWLVVIFVYMATQEKSFHESSLDFMSDLEILYTLKQSINLDRVYEAHNNGGEQGKGGTCPLRAGCFLKHRL
jgi:hypothetical protein